jgi:hypothetical protein
MVTAAADRAALLAQAGGSLKEARRLILEFLARSENRVTSVNADDHIDLLDFTRRIEILRADLDASFAHKSKL